MARPRVPMAKAISTGRVLHDPKRFANRNEPESTGPLGPPPVWMTNKRQKAAWERFRAEIPWLQKAHSNAKGSRKPMIVALARKLIIALWRYANDGVIPEGFRLHSAA
jgi:hypothetical protein